MLAEVEAQAKTREKHLERQLCESRGSERALWAELRGVARKLLQADGVADSLQARPDRACGRAHGLKQEPARAEGTQRETEDQRGQLWSMLRPSVGLHGWSPVASPEPAGPPSRGQCPPRPPSHPPGAPQPPRGSPSLPESEASSVRGRGACASVSTPHRAQR